MKESQKVEMGFTERIYSKPKEQYTKNFWVPFQLITFFNFNKKKLTT